MKTKPNYKRITQEEMDEFNKKMKEDPTVKFEVTLSEIAFIAPKNYLKHNKNENKEK